MKKTYSLFVLILVISRFSVFSQCASPATIPYFQDFQSISVNNQLPSCWAVDNASACLTYSAASFAAFYNASPGTANFYSNGLQLYSGVIYSVSVWHQLSSFSFSNPWTNFFLALGPNQNAINAFTVASTTNLANTTFASLSNTFTVPNSGVYHLTIGASNTLTSGSSLLVWDDLSLTIPCTSLYNKPNVSIVASATSICSGQAPGQLVLMASGADTYTWSTGANTSTITDSPGSPQVYTVTGTNTLTSCASSASIAIGVNPSPNVILLASPFSVCKGSSANLTAYGAQNYTWSTGAQTAFITVSPSVSTTYTVYGSNNFGCVSTAVQLIQVNATPTLSIYSAVPSTTICNGEQDTLRASGAIQYQWSFGQSVLQGSEIVVSPSVTTNYILTGTDNNNCSSQSTFVLHVNGCTGLTQLSRAENEVHISPNPFQEEFLLNSGNNDLKSIEVTDLSGRTILSIQSREERFYINTRYYAQGIYYVRVKTENKTQVLKVIKN